MKKYLFILLFAFLFIPNIYAESISIKSVKLDYNSENVTINSEPTFNGLEMNFDIGFVSKDDYVKYKVIIANNTNTDYKVTSNQSFNASEYITYEYSSDTIIKASSESEVYIIIKYSKEVDDSLYVNGKYNESNKAILELRDEEGNIVNAKTGNNILSVFIFILAFSIVVLIILLKQESFKLNSFIIIISLLFLPIFVKAIESLKLTMNIKVNIEKAYRVSYKFDGIIKSSDRSKYDMSNAVCSETYYVNSKTEDNKYEFCESIIIHETKLYKKDERVTVKELTINEPVVYVSRLEESNCNMEVDNTYLCNDVSFENQVYREFAYILSDNTRYVVDSDEVFNMPEEDVVLIHDGPEK